MCLFCIHTTHTVGFTDEMLEAASLKRPVKYQRRPSIMHNRSWPFGLETLIARRMGQAFMMKMRSQTSMKTNSCIEMTLRMRMAMLWGVEVVPKRRIEIWEYVGWCQVAGNFLSLSHLPVYLYTSMATSFHTTFLLGSSQAGKNNTNNTETSCNC